MTVQTIEIGRKKFVLLAEGDFRKLQKRAAAGEVRPDFAEEAMKELRAYRKTGKARRWEQVKADLGE